MKICWFGIYRKQYPRNDILLNGLEQNNIEIVECNVGGMERFRYFKLIYKFLKLKNDYDVIYVAFPSQLSVIVAKIFSRKKVVMDAFISMYDAMVFDRREIGKFRPRALKFLFLDWLSVFLADLVITDTEAHKKFWGSWKFINIDKIKVVYLGINDKLIKPLEKRRRNDIFLVHFHGSYIPLQGAIKIIEAASILRDNNSIRFRMVGSGQDYQKAMNLMKEKGLNNIEIMGRVSYQMLNDYLNEADVVLGIFGDTEKSNRVIPNKLYEGLAVAKPVITKDSPAIRELFSENEIMIIENTPEALAEAILTLKNNKELREKIAQNGYRKIKEILTPKSVASTLIKHLNMLLSSQKYD